MTADAVACATLRSLLHAETPDEVLLALHDGLRALGAAIVPADDADADAGQVDVSLGRGEPLRATAPAGSGAADNLDQYVDTLVTDAHRALDVAIRLQRVATEVTVDPLTRIGNEVALDRLLPRITTRDVLVAIGLDGLGEVHDDHGRAAGDEVLISLATCLREQLRAFDHAMRIGDDEFVLVLVDADDGAAREIVGRLRAAWEQVRPHPVGFSAGISGWVGSADETRERADAMLYQAKAHGRLGNGQGGPTASGRDATPGVPHP